MAENSIRVNAIAPGYIHTPILDAIPNKADLEIAVNLHPLKRFGEPKKIANTAIFLASDKFSFFTGVTIPVDGGYTAV